MDFPIGHVRTRREELAQRYRDKEFGDYSDIKRMLKQVGGTMVDQVTHLPPQGDTPTYDAETWRKMHESRNKKSGTTWTWY